MRVQARHEVETLRSRLLLDLRTVDPEDDPALVAAVRAALAG